MSADDNLTYFKQILEALNNAGILQYFIIIGSWAYHNLFFDALDEFQDCTYLESQTLNLSTLIHAVADALMVPYGQRQLLVATLMNTIPLGLAHRLDLSA